MQGKQLKVLRDVIMGEKNSHSLHILNDSALKERIDKGNFHENRNVTAESLNEGEKTRKGERATYAQIVTGNKSQDAKVKTVRFEDSTH